MKEENKRAKEERKKIGKAYKEYTKDLLPKPTYFANCLRAFAVGGAICTMSYYVRNMLMETGLSDKNASIYVTVILIVSAQLLTGFGLFDTFGKFAGAGIIVPITGFANSIVAPAIEYKKEGPVLGVGAKLFSVAGPVLVCGISAATLVGIIYWIYYQIV